MKQQGVFINENDSEETETNKTCVIPSLMPQMLRDYEITEIINSLNPNQREVFNVVHTWVKDM